MGAMFVSPEYLEEYNIEADQIRERFTFSESAVLSTVFLKDGEPVPQTHLIPDPESGFNEAEVTIRYKLVKSPSNQLQTMITKQKWVVSGDVWYLIPDLEPFLK